MLRGVVTTSRQGELRLDLRLRPGAALLDRATMEKYPP
jgi:hypothetical protein